MEVAAGLRNDRRDEKAARSGHLSGRDDIQKLRQADDSTSPVEPHRGRIRVMESEADILERGAKILAGAPFANSGPAMEQLGRALEVLLRKEAARTRSKATASRSLVAMFPSERAA